MFPDGHIETLDERRRTQAYWQKIASAYQAADREFMTASGHPIELVEAMTTQTAELWWSPSKQSLSSRRPSGFQISNDWEQLDDHDTVLTLTGDKAVEIGIAVGMARTVNDIPQLLGISGPVELIDLSHIVRRHNANVHRRITAFHKNANRFLKAQRAIQKEMDLMPGVNWDIPQKDRSQATVDVNRRLGKISDNVAQCRSAVGALRRIDRLLIKRRIQTRHQPNILARIDDEVEALGEMRAMLRRYMKHDLLATQSWDERKAQITASCKVWSLITGN